MPEPSARVKSAVRSVLRDESSQYHFTKLLNNSINQKFEIEGFYDKIVNKDPLLGEYEALKLVEITSFMLHLINTRAFYNGLLMSLNLNLNPACVHIFNRNLNKNLKLFVKHEIILEKLHQFFDDNLLRFKSNVLNIIPMLKFLEASEMVDELSQIVVNVFIKKIKLHINQNFTRVWDRPILDDLNDFIKYEIYPNIQFILTNVDLKIAFNDLVKIGYNELTSLRINEIYKIIMDFPASKISLVELNNCLNYQTFHSYDKNIEYHQRNKLVENFTINSNLNLLNSGINTIHLIQSYIKIIKSFLIIDPKGVLLDKVIRPIRRYLKTRDDIINKLVLGLLDKEPELVDLSKELQDTEKNLKVLKNIDDFNDLNWTPDPIDALPDFKKFKINDIIQSLISIFDSKDIFIVEFTKLFGNKLINNEEDLHAIMNLINLLKLRFGKNEFFNLDIMIKDYVNYTSTNKHSKHTLKPLILSHLYWSDIIDESNFKLHPKLVQLFEAYNDDVYKKYNQSRYLKVIPNFGNVSLDLAGKLYNVTLDKASVMFMFDDTTEAVSISTICQQLEMSDYIASKCLEYWVQEDIIVKVTNTLYVINE